MIIQWISNQALFLCKIASFLRHSYNLQSGYHPHAQLTYWSSARQHLGCECTERCLHPDIGSHGDCFLYQHNSHHQNEWCLRIEGERRLRLNEAKPLHIHTGKYMSPSVDQSLTLRPQPQCSPITNPKTSAPV